MIWRGLNEESNARISFSTFSDNRATGDAGALHASDSTVIISGNIFTNNTASATVCGGALYFYQVTAVIVLCHFINNNASYAAGAINSEDYSYIIVRDSTFIHNTVDGNGGAMSFRDSTAIISGSEFALNNASIDGGALNARYSQVSISDCSFNSCNSLRGSAIRTSYGNISIDYVAFNMNSSKSRGGGISINEASGSIVNSTL